LSGLKAVQSFSTVEIPSNKASYTIKNFNCGWETDTSGNYTFNISNITLNVPENNSDSDTTSGLLSSTYLFDKDLGTNDDKVYPAALPFFPPGWADLVDSKDSEKYTPGELLNIEYESSKESLSKGSLTDIRNETYYILLEKE
jgi:hypothetical protein